MKMNQAQRAQQLAALERTLDDQADLVRKMAKGMRLAYSELQKDIPDIHRLIDILDEHYPGHRGQLQQSLKGRRNQRD